jgi:peroxiredoxin (alkyl hydroperoxide reductase subunit C)
MKQKITIIAVLCFFAVQAWAQETGRTNIPMIGDNAPSFTAESTNGKVVFPEDFGRNWKIIFSHPADFTPVCSSELLELGSMQKDFKELGVKLIVLSSDNVDTHEQWVKSLETIKYKNHDLVDITFPLVEDKSHDIARKYGMIHPNNNSTKDVRGVYFIDPDNKIRAMLFYPMNMGRNTAEIKRMVQALQTADQAHVLTPANWQPGGDVMIPYTGGATANAQSTAEAGSDPNLYQLSWYMTFRKMDK